ncbi:MAG: winged helix-turn-helix domain-containing protein [Methanobacterium paludis]|nr:winged helix-turn-helix domain-containing protein [Methanobacterium paludis]
MNNMNPKDPHQDMRIELFATPDSVYAIDSPVRVKILSLLREGELSFDKIAELSGKAKSTVSVHLKKMAKEGIIGSKQDPDDARKKIFFIKSEYLGKLSSKKMLKDGIDLYLRNQCEKDKNPENINNISYYLETFSKFDSTLVLMIRDIINEMEQKNMIKPIKMIPKVIKK